MADGTVWGLDANAVTGMAGQMVQDPRQQMALQQQQANQAAAAQQQLAQQNAAFGMQMGNQAENLNAQRRMALAAQSNAAQNVANQLNQLGQARSANAQLIQGAMQGAAGLFR